jgi:plastocyanin
MAKQAIGVGSSPNDGTGNTLRDGGVKINSNFDELYNGLGGSTIRIAIPSSSISNGATLKFDGTNFVPNSDIDTNTTYAISSETVTSGAKVRLTGSDSSTDDISILTANAGLTITRTDASTITLTNNNPSPVTFSLSAEAIQAGQRTIRLTGSNASLSDIALIAGTGMTISNPTASSITLDSAIVSVNGATGTVITNRTYSFGGGTSNHYVVTGPGLPTAGSNDPDIIAQRGETIRFTNTRSGQILEILDTSNAAPAGDYISSQGSSANIADQNQTITFTIPMSASTGNTFKYRSQTEPANMLGNIVVI